MVSTLPSNNKKFALHNQKQFVSSVLYSNGKIVYCFSIGHTFYTQNVWSWLQKFALNNMNISPCTISQFKPVYPVCFPKLLQEYLLSSTYSLLKSKMKKRNWIIWHFSFMESCLPSKQENFRFTYRKTIFITHIVWRIMQ